MSGEIPTGSTGGLVTFLMIKGKTALVSDGSTVGRSWPAKWDSTNQRWVATGPGVQLKDGKVVETFPTGTIPACKDGQVTDK